MRSCRAWQPRRGSKVARSVERWRVSAGTSPSLRSETYTHTLARKPKQPQGQTIKTCFGLKAVAHPFFCLFSSPSPCVLHPLSLPFSTSRARLTYCRTPRPKSRRTWSRSTTLLWPATSARRALEWWECAPKHDEPRRTNPPRVLEDPRRRKQERGNDQIAVVAAVANILICHSVGERRTGELMNVKKKKKKSSKCSHWPPTSHWALVSRSRQSAAAASGGLGKRNDDGELNVARLEAKAQLLVLYLNCKYTRSLSASSYVQCFSAVSRRVTGGWDHFSSSARLKL